MVVLAAIFVAVSPLLLMAAVKEAGHLLLVGIDEVNLIMIAVVALLVAAIGAVTALYAIFTVWRLLRLRSFHKNE